MAISASAVWEVRTTATGGANVNGGFFVTGASGVNYSEQNGAQYALTGGTTAGADAVLLHANAAADMVGNGLKVVSGTNATVGWYEVISVVVGVSITLDRNIASGVGSNIVANVGGAISLTASDDAVFESLVAGNIMWIKAGTYVIGGTVTIAAAGTVNNPITIRGYNAARGDNPTGATRPLFDNGAVPFSLGANFKVEYMRFTGTGTNTLAAGAGSRLSFCKVTNTSTTVLRAGLSHPAAATQSIYYYCEFICYRGRAVSQATTGDGAVFYGCYFHDSNTGLFNAGSGGMVTLINCIFADIVSSSVNVTKTTGIFSLINCTLYGRESKNGIGVDIGSGSSGIQLLNNIFYGFETAVVHADTPSLGCVDNFNNYFNNTTDNTNWVKGANDIALAPAFTGVAQITGATATTSGSVLTQSGADFSTVTDNVDFCDIVSGTGVTQGKYLITSHTGTTLTLDIAPGTDATADKVFSVVTGHNFAVGANMQAVGTPGVYPAGLTTAYTDIGAVQRKERASTDPGIAKVDLGTAYTINDVPLVGTRAVSSGGGNRGVTLRNRGKGISL